VSHVSALGLNHFNVAGDYNWTGDVAPKTGEFSAAALDGSPARHDNQAR
jgi:hypothetical protein